MSITGGVVQIKCAVIDFWLLSSCCVGSVVCFASTLGFDTRTKQKLERGRRRGRGGGGGGGSSVRAVAEMKILFCTVLNIHRELQCKPI